jgi:hypothetical protein
MNGRRGNGFGAEPSLGEIADRINGIEQYIGQLGRLKVAEDVTEDWVLFPFRFLSIAPGGTAVITKTVSGDGPYDAIEITYTAVDAATPPVATNAFRFRIKEGEAVGRTLTQDGDFIDADNGAGTAQRPYIIKGRRRFRANIAIQVEITNTSASATLTIELVIHGIKVFTR